MMLTAVRKCGVVEAKTSAMRSEATYFVICTCDEQEIQSI